MLKLTRTGIGLLTRQYRSVLHKCWLINVGLWQAMGDAVSKAVSVPARLIASLLSGGALNGEAFNVLDEILLSRLFERKLASLTAIGLTIAAATLPSEAEAGLLCYASDGTVKYSTGTDCPAGTTTRLISLGAIHDSATIGSGSVALGLIAQATGSGSTALGYNAQATNNYATAVGYYVEATGKNSMALGYYAQANGEGSAALGVNAQATKNNATALGSGAEATGAASMALGKYTQATNTNSTAIGYNSHATGENSTAQGYYAVANGKNSVALGYYAQTNGENSVALGNNAKATGESSTAIGNKSVADEANTVSVGRFGADSATVEQMKTDIDGGMSDTEFEDKYAQYSGAWTLYMAYTSWGYDWDGAVETSNIAGEYHRITNVADAEKAHDAVTLGQLQNNYYRKLMKKDKIFDTNEGIMDVKSLKKGTNSSQERIIKGVSAFPSIICAYPFDTPHTANDNHKNVIVRSAFKPSSYGKRSATIGSRPNQFAEILVSSTRMTGKESTRMTRKESIKMTGNATTTKQAA